MNKTEFSQADMQNLWLPLIEKHGQLFRKSQKIWAREAQLNEHVLTYTADGLETENWAKSGDFLVKNVTSAGEEYLMSAAKFEQRYVFSKKIDEKWSEFLPTGQVHAIEITEKWLNELGLPFEFYFLAGWGSEMIVKIGDFLVSPLDFSEVYRIARKEFFETYSPV